MCCLFCRLFRIKPSRFECLHLGVVYCHLMLVLLEIVSFLIQKIVLVFHLELRRFLEERIYPPRRCSVFFIPAFMLLQRYSLGLHSGILCHSALALHFCFIPVYTFQSSTMKMQTLMHFFICTKSCH
jgi:hypothetical protein